MSTLATFATGFVVRPFGALVFGRIGDLVGRKYAFLVTLLIMGGAATYVAEHAPEGRKGFYTSFIQTTATLGLFVSIGVILTTRLNVGEVAFKAWGWRIPFLLSFALVIFSYVIRSKLHESPEFTKMKAEGKGSTSPLRDSFMNPYNRKWVILALFGATAGNTVFYCLWCALGSDWAQKHYPDRSRLGRNLLHPDLSGNGISGWL